MLSHEARQVTEWVSGRKAVWISEVEKQQAMPKLRLSLRQAYREWSVKQN